MPYDVKNKTIPAKERAMAGTFYDDEVEVTIGKTTYDVAYLFDRTLMDSRRSSITTACKKCQHPITKPFQLVWIHRQRDGASAISPDSSLGKKIMTGFRKHLRDFFGEPHNCDICVEMTSIEI